MQDCNAAKVSRVNTDDDQEIAKLESKMSKVSNMCGKLLTTVQQLNRDGPLCAVIANLIETVRLSNQVQEEVHQRYRSKKVSEVSEKSSTGPYGSFWDQADFQFPAPPTNTVSIPTGKNHLEDWSLCLLMREVSQVVSLKPSRLRLRKRKTV
jgi:hypothetical protein